MARNLLRAGHDLTVWNRTANKAEPLAKDGAKVSHSAAQAAKDSDLAITMLADDHAVESAVLHSGAMIESLRKGATHVSMSTISVDLSRRLAAAHVQRSQHYVAAPVFGRPDAAEQRKLFVVAAGEQAAVEACGPIFEALGQRTFLIGEKPEMANVVKLSGNFLLASAIESLAEAIALARKYGIDPRQYVDLLTSTLFAAPAYKTYGGLIADGRYEAAGFALRLGLKDVDLALAAAERVDASLPIASLVRDHILMGIARGYDKHDWSVLGRLAAENAGL